jgi:homoserine kinase
MSTAKSRYSSCPRSARAFANNQIPGLPKILSNLTPTTHPGLLGICLSGAGPTILALATENFDGIAKEIIRLFKEENVEVDWELLEVDERGSWVEEL